MNLLSRLRAWLRPYPDAAELQRRMLLRVEAVRHWRRDMRDGFRKLDEARESIVAAGRYARMMDDLIAKQESKHGKGPFKITVK